MANVLVFFMSTRIDSKPEIYYRYEGDKVEKYQAEDKLAPMTNHTNLGTAKALVHAIGKIDKISYLASESVRATTVKKGDKIESKESDENWFKGMLDSYLKDCKITVPEYIGIPINDNFSDSSVMDSAINLIDRLKLTKGDKVYIDYTGGMRQAASILLAISKILKLKGFEVTILTNYYNIDKKEEYKNPHSPLVINENKNVSNGVDYVSATQYFLATGDISRLKNWFEITCASNEITLEQKERDIIEKFEQFYKAISLCQADITTACWDALQTELDNYENIEKENKTSTFAYVVDLMSAEMEKEGDSNIVSLIYWCLRHNFIQQAVTIFNEKLPLVVNDKLTKQQLMYKFPKEIKDRETKQSYFGIYDRLQKDSSSVENISATQIEFKKRYLLLDAVRDYTNHASGEENHGQIEEFLAKMKEEGIVEVDNIRAFLENVDGIKEQIINVLDNIKGYQDAWENYNTKEK